MSDFEPYLRRQPGDPITVEDYHELQRLIQQDIAAKVNAAMTEIRAGGVSHADDADTFAHRSDAGWKQELDQRYAQKSHSHEGPAVYRRYLKEFTIDPGLDRVLLRHGLGRYPLVDVYQLMDATNGAVNTGGQRMFVYYGHEDEETYGLSVRVGRERVRLGVRLEQLLPELAVGATDDSSIADVVNDVWDALRKEPNDEIRHGVSPWVKDRCDKDRKIGQLKRSQEWDDLYLGLRPRRCTPLCGSVAVPDGSGQFEVLVDHIDHDALALTINGLDGDRSPLDLMILLRA